MVKVTVPVGVPADTPGETTAVKVTGWPTVDGFHEDDTVVTVASSAADRAAFENAEVFPVGSVAVAV
jgi:hypothetical protein